MYNYTKAKTLAESMGIIDATGAFNPKAAYGKSPVKKFY
jgi:hypothetical protein